MTADEIEALVDAAAAALSLPISPEHRLGVLRYFALAAQMAEQIDSVPLTPHDEPAVNFTPVSVTPVSVAPVSVTPVSSAPSASSASPASPAS